jgi:hypothetical protein
MQSNATQQSGQNRVKRNRHVGSFSKVLDGRKQPIRGLWIRNGRYYARLSVEADNGMKKTRWVTLVTPADNPVETVAGRGRTGAAPHTTHGRRLARSSSLSDLKYSIFGGTFFWRRCLCKHGDPLRSD